MWAHALSRAGGSDSLKTRCDLESAASQWWALLCILNSTYVYLQ